MVRELTTNTQQRMEPPAMFGINLSHHSVPTKTETLFQMFLDGAKKPGATSTRTPAKEMMLNPQLSLVWTTIFGTVMETVATSTNSQKPMKEKVDQLIQEQLILQLPVLHLLAFYYSDCDVK